MRTMKTHIELDDELLKEVLQLGGFATQKAAVNTALAEYAKMLKRRELLAMGWNMRPSPSGVCTHPRFTRCAIRRRRCASPSCA